MKLRRNVIRTSLKQSANDKFQRSSRSKRILFVYREEDSEIWWKSFPGRRDEMKCERGQIICPYCNVRRIGLCQGVDQLHYQTNFNLTRTRSTQWKNAQSTYTFHGSETFRRSSKSRSRLPWSAASFPSNHVLFLRPDSSYQQQRKTCYLPIIKKT